MNHTPTAILTGAASGIGRRFAESLAAQGNDLILLDIDQPGLAATEALVAQDNRRVRSATVDVADRGQLERAVEQLVPGDEKIDLLVNCAAILGAGIWAAQKPEEFERVLQVNLLGTVNATRAALPALRRARGHVVILASTAAVHGWPQLSAYSAAKFGLVGYAEAIRPELAVDGIGLTVVFPLLIDTPLLSRPGTPPILQRGRPIPAEAVVSKTLRAVTRRQRRVYVPSTVRFIVALHAIAPSLLDWFGRRFGMDRKQLKAKS